MNIFVTDPNPVVCAEWLDDFRLNKMILESAQMLSTALRAHGVCDDVIYRTAHLNHPCTVWTRETRGNFRWLVRHALAMCKLFRKKSGKTHACEKITRHCSTLKMYIPSGKQTQFSNCTPYKDVGTHNSIFERYKHYMIDKWDNDIKKPTWFLRSIPEWYSSNQLEANNEQ